MNLHAKKMPRGDTKWKVSGPNPAALIRLLPQSGELSISHEARMETISLPLNRHAETSKTMSLSSNGKRHYLQANSGRQPSPSTASRKRQLQWFKSRFAFSRSTYKLRENSSSGGLQSVFQSLKAAQFPFQYKERWNPRPLPRQPLHCNQHSCPWHKAGGRAPVPEGGQTTGQGCRAWLAPTGSASEGTRKSKTNPLAQQGSKRPTLYC